MKKVLMRFSENVLTRSQMKNVRGGDDYGGEGWCYHYFCECGGNVFSNVGNYQQYQSDCAGLVSNHQALIGLVAETRKIHPGMGLRQIWELTRPKVGRDAFIEVGMKHHLGTVSPQNPVRTTYSIKSNRYSNLLGGKTFTDVNQIWVCDITYFKDKLGNTFYLFFLMDAYSRRIIGHTASDNMRAENAIKVLMMAFKIRGLGEYLFKLIHHSDRGSQYVSNEYTHLLDTAQIQVSMCLSALENAHIERVNGTIKNQYLKYWAIDSLKSLVFYLDKAVQAYNYSRPHRSLKGMPPIKYEQNLLTIPINQRTKMKIFTYKIQPKSKVDKNQLSLFCTI